MTNKTRVWFFLALQTCGVSVQAVESTHEVSQSGHGETIRHQSIAKEIKKPQDISSEETKGEQKEEEETKEGPRFELNADSDARSWHVAKMHDMINLLDELPIIKNHTECDPIIDVIEGILKDCHHIPTMKKIADDFSDYFGEYFSNSMASNNTTTNSQQCLCLFETLTCILRKKLIQGIKAIAPSHGIASNLSEERERDMHFKINACLESLQEGYNHYSKKKKEAKKTHVYCRKENSSRLQIINDMLIKCLGDCNFLQKEKCDLIAIRDKMINDPNDVLSLPNIANIVNIANVMKNKADTRLCLRQSLQQESKQFDTHVRREAHIISPQTFSAPAHKSLASGQRAHHHPAITHDVTHRDLLATAPSNAKFQALSFQDQQHALQISNSTLKTPASSFNPAPQSSSIQPNQAFNGFTACEPQTYPMASGPHMAQTALHNVSGVNQSLFERTNNTTYHSMWNTSASSFNPGTQPVSWSSNALHTDAMPYFPSIQPNQAFNGFTACEPQAYPMASGPHTAHMAQTALHNVSGVNQSLFDRTNNTNFGQKLNNEYNIFNP